MERLKDDPTSWPPRGRPRRGRQRRIHMCVTLPPALVMELEDEAREAGCSRSVIVEGILVKAGYSID